MIRPPQKKHQFAVQVRQRLVSLWNNLAWKFGQLSSKGMNLDTCGKATMFCECHRSTAASEFGAELGTTNALFLPTPLQGERYAQSQILFLVQYFWLLTKKKFFVRSLFGNLTNI